jgi:hypothetical protein
MPKKAAPAAPKQTPEEIAAAAAKAEAAAILAEQTLAARDQPVFKQLVVRLILTDYVNSFGRSAV